MMTEAPLATFEANALGRDFAVGDIHGRFSSLREGLKAIDFNPAQDRLFALGDLVDRGPESVQVLDWLDEPWFHSVRGNHELMTCDALAGDSDAVRFHENNGGAWLRELSQAERTRIDSALQSLPIAIEVATALGPVGLVHADFPTDDWQHLRDGALTARDLQYCLWSVDRYQRQYTGHIRNIRAVVHGHMTIDRMAVLGNVYFIDTKGRGGQGQFTFLELGTLKAHQPAPSWLPRLGGKRH
jgi:serine/threonine protein phosphatase 1